MNSSYSIEFANRQSRLAVHPETYSAAIGMILEESQIAAAEISLVIVSDVEMHELNVKHLEHDYPTDVLSFPLENSSEFLAGEVVVSIDTAEKEAVSHGLTTDEELLLYVVHGTLHLVGYDDKSEEARLVMRQKERHFMEKNGVSLQA